MKTTGLYKLSAFFFLFFFAIVSVKAQPNEPVWKFTQTSSPSQITDMLTDSLGNCYVAGTFYSEYFRYQNDSVPGMTGGESTNAYIMKINPTGKLIWLYSIYSATQDGSIEIKKISTSERGEVALIIKANYTSNIWFGTQNITVLPDYENTLIAKIGKNKQITWVHKLVSTYYGVNPGQMDAMDLFVEETGSVYLTGYFRGETAQLSDMIIDGTGEFTMLFVARIEPEGNVAWFKNCPYGNVKSSANIYATTIRNAPGNKFYIGGYFDGNQDFYFGIDTLNYAMAVDAFFACYTKDGNSQWAKMFRGDSTDYAENIIIMQNGDPVFVGYCSSNIVTIEDTQHESFNGNFNIYIARYNETGNYIKSTGIYIQKFNYSSAGENAFINRDADDNLIVCSEFQSASVLDNEFTLVNPQPGTSDLLFAKLNGFTFAPFWSFHGTAPGNNYFQGIHIDKFGNIFFSGNSNSELILDTLVITENLIYGNPYTAKISTGGTLSYLYWQTNTADNAIVIDKISSDVYGNAFVLGSFRGKSNSLGDTDIVSPDNEGSVLAKYSRVKNINGQVKNIDGDAVNNGYVKIYGHTLYQESPLNDSVLLEADGSFEFYDVPSGNYLLVVRPEGSAAGSYIPTYYPSAEYWENAQTVRISPQTDPGLLNIIIRRISEFNGITEMGGNVSYADDEKLFPSGYWNKGRPTKRATVILAGNKKPEKSAYEIVATTETNDEGYFSFYNVEDGFYHLWVDIPGLPCEPVYFIEVSGNQYISNLNYLVDEETIQAVGYPVFSRVTSLSGNSGVLLFPVPANEYINIVLPEAAPGMADIFDARGSHIQSIGLKQSVESINLTGLLPGNYTIRIMFSNSVVFKKFNIIR